MSHDSRLEIKNILSDRYCNVRITDINTVEDLNAVIARRPHLVFLGMKFIDDETNEHGDPIWLSQRLLEAGIAFTGSGEIASTLEHNKQFAKERVSEQGFATAAALTIEHGATYTEEDIKLTYPVFVKPADGGGGSGINEQSLVHNFEDLKSQITWLMNNCRSDILIEAYLPGREFSVGILKDTYAGNFDLMPLEIVAPVNQTGARFLSSSIKRADSERTLEVTNLKLKHELSMLALGAFEALGGEDYGRIDIRLDADGKPHFLEANLLPSLLNNYGNLPKAALLNIGLSHVQLVLQIAELGLSKMRNKAPIDRSLTYSADHLPELNLQPVY